MAIIISHWSTINRISRGSMFFLFILLSNNAFSQDVGDTLTYYNGKVYDSQMNKLKIGQMEYFMQDHSTALSRLQSAKISRITGISLMTASLVVLIGLEGAGEYEGATFWTLFGAAMAASVGGAILSFSVYKRNIRSAVNFYNSAISSSTPSRGYSVSVGLTSTGVGIALRF